MMEPLRLFSPEDRKEHSLLVGKQCQWEVEKGKRCGETAHLEADHTLAFSKGGMTEEENFLWACLPHHALKHLIDGEKRSAQLIEKRMDYAELMIYWELRRSLGL